MAAWIRVGLSMRHVGHTAVLGTLLSGCGFAALQVYSVGVEEIPVTARDPVVASDASRRLRPSYVSVLPHATSYEYPVPLQWLAKTPDATELSRNTWLCWAFVPERRIIRWLSSSGAGLLTPSAVEQDALEPGTNIFGIFDVLEKTRDGSSALYRFGRGPDPRSLDGVHRFTVAIEDDLAVFGLSSAIWSATTPDRPTWLEMKFHEIYAKLLLKAAVQRMLRPREERQKFETPKQATQAAVEGQSAL